VRPLRPWLVFLWTVLLVLLTCAPGEARPGGGHTFSSGHGSGGGSDGGDGAGLVIFLIRLVIEAPAIGIPAVIVVGVIYVVVRRRAGSENWEYRQEGTPLPVGPTPGEEGFAGLMQRDPEFSTVLFDDFCYALYARAQKARASTEDLSRLAPYLSEQPRSDLQARSPAGVPVEEVVIGEMRIKELILPAAGAVGPMDAFVSVQFVANLGLGAAAAQYVQETWILARSITAVTRPWKGIRSFNCPACGAPFEVSGTSRCASCGNDVDGGQFDWVVRRIDLAEVQSLPPTLTKTVEEEGTDRRTVSQPDSSDRWASLMADDPSLTGVAFDARLRLIFSELEGAWEALDPSLARAFISDALASYLRYWTDAYRAQGLKNVNEGAAVSRWAIAKVLRDKHYDAVTVRIWASGRDSTVNVATGKVVSGNPKVERRYSEYWTLIRGASARGAPRQDKACPGCGAPLRVNMAGNCEYCNVLITSGDFDWVLSRIEQDDSYAG
jgi:predicted lipid-binding transport protein (Tim44 family)